MPSSLRVLETIEMNILNNKGLRIHPCLSPTGQSKKSVIILSFPLTADSTLLYNDFKTFRNDPVIPYLSKTVNKANLLILS